MKKTSFADKSSQKETSWISVKQVVRRSISTLPLIFRFSIPCCLFDVFWRTEQGSNWRQPLSPPWWGTHLHRWCAACNLWKSETKTAYTYTHLQVAWRLGSLVQWLEKSQLQQRERLGTLKKFQKKNKDTGWRNAFWRRSNICKDYFFLTPAFRNVVFLRSLL